MRLVNSINDISDGKVYDIDDTVKADTDGCVGCSDCCKDVGDLVVLNPLDMYMLVKNINKEFEELINDKLKLIEENKILLPHLNMKEDKSCSFLNEEGRCEIHSSRPNICRLFPLGRMYLDNDIKYFLQVNNCPKDNLKEIGLKEWIGVENYSKNKEFLLEWYKFIKALTFRLKFIRDEDELKNINQILLDNFYRNYLIVFD